MRNTKLKSIWMSDDTVKMLKELKSVLSRESGVHCYTNSSTVCELIHKEWIKKIKKGVDIK